MPAMSPWSERWKPMQGVESRSWYKCEVATGSKLVCFRGRSEATTRLPQRNARSRCLGNCLIQCPAWNLAISVLL
jgi:hypothetical protein